MENKELNNQYQQNWEKVASNINTQEPVAMSGWLQFFLGALIIGAIYSVFVNIFLMNIGDYGNNYLLMISDLSSVLLTSGMALYVVWAFWKRKANAVFMGWAYLVIILISNFLSLMTWENNTMESPGALPPASILRGLFWSIVWALYLYHSSNVKELCPLEERRFLKKDYYIIGMTVLIPLLFLIMGLSYTPSPPSVKLDTVADNMDTYTSNHTSFVIDESMLKKNEITDGISIVTIPQGMASKEVTLEDDTKLIYLLDEKDMNSYEIRIISGQVESFNSEDFEKTWSARREHEIENVPCDIIRNDVSDINDYKCYWKSSLCKSASPFLWDYIFLFDYKSHKFCWINVMYPEKAQVPIDEVIKGIKFEQ